MKKLLVMTGIFFLLSGLNCWAQTTIKVGTTTGADVEILEKVQELAAKEGLTVEIIEFGDYRQVNDALVNKELDLNAFQHQPYLDEYNQENKTQLVSLGSTYVAPLGFFSKKIKNLNELKNSDKVAIPNDPTNGGRALLLLQKAGVIKLKPGVGLNPTTKDIIDNPKNLEILELDAAQTAHSLDDVATAAIDNTFAIPFGLNPLRDSIYLESVDSPYVNVIAARPEDRENPLFLRLVKVYQSQDVADFIYSSFDNSTIPAFPHQKKTQGR
ncbi:MAG: MetQ/NlpA family ABC transporter substrate-binding protein [Deltaproteobacteria bacterium]|jgi:D-methionine transport system substrate-binding protein|nr:MetQ/NlpA family ABC transporter substrate-binding protein [Deltaproteobacteria bacterium]